MCDTRVESDVATFSAASAEPTTGWERIALLHKRSQTDGYLFEQDSNECILRTFIAGNSSNLMRTKIVLCAQRPVLCAVRCVCISVWLCAELEILGARLVVCDAEKWCQRYGMECVPVHVCQSCKCSCFWFCSAVREQSCRVRHQKTDECLAIW